MIQLITTGNEDVDNPNIVLLAKNIHRKAVFMHKEYVAHLEANLKEFNKKISELQPHADELTDLLE